MKGRHRVGDTVIIEAKVTGVDEGNLVEKEIKDAEDKVIGTEYEGDTFVHLNVLGTDLSCRGSQLASPVSPITAEEPQGVEPGESTLDSASSAGESTASSASAEGNAAAKEAASLASSETKAVS